MVTEKVKIDKRCALVEAAKQLFHEKGIPQTSLADIAERAEVPLGNVYYYFKTKEELGLAVVDCRKDDMAENFQQLEQTIDDPRQRLIAAVAFFDQVKEPFTRYGCPLATVVQSLDPEENRIAQYATEAFHQFVDWLALQFRELGFSKKQARQHAITLTAGVQGAGLMARSFADPDIVSVEIKRLIAWIESL